MSPIQNPSQPKPPKYPSFTEYLITTRDEALSIVIRSEQWLKGLGCLESDTMPGELRTERVIEVVRKEKRWAVGE